MKTIVIDKHELKDFLEENLKGKSCKSYYFVGVSDEGIYDAYLPSENSWINYPGIKILEFENGFCYTSYEYLYQLFSEVDDEQAAYNLEVTAVWESMTTDEKVNCVFDNVDADKIERFCEASWDVTYSEELIPAIEENLNEFEVIEDTDDYYVVKVDI